MITRDMEHAQSMNFGSCTITPVGKWIIITVGLTISMPPLSRSVSLIAELLTIGPLASGNTSVNLINLVHESSFEHEKGWI